MAKPIRKIVEEVKTDKYLSPYFIDYIGENLKMRFGNVLEMQRPDGSTFDEVADAKLTILLNQLKSKVPKKHVDVVLNEVCKYYARMVFLTF